MIRFILVLFLAFVQTACMSPPAVPPASSAPTARTTIGSQTLIGIWKSDAESSASYNRQHSKLDPQTLAQMNDALGRTTLTVTADQLTIQVSNSALAGGNLSRSGTGYGEPLQYKIIESSPDTLKLKTRERGGSPERIRVIHFDSPDRIWIYVGAAEQGKTDEQLRQYFVRVH